MSADFSMVDEVDEMGAFAVDSPIFSTLAPFAIICLNLCSIWTVVVLLYLLATSHLHKNCRYLLTVWSLSFLVQFLAHISLFLGWLSDGPPQSRDIADSSTTCSIGAQLFCSALEIVISGERMLSSSSPAKYHNRGFGGGVLLPLTLILFGATSALSNATHDGEYFVFFSVVFTLDIVTITMNCISTKYCKRRYKSLFGRSSLNGRYQAKEAYEIAALMQPAYCYAFIAKSLLGGLTFSFCYQTSANFECISMWIPLEYPYIEAAYFCVTTVIASSLVMWLILVHPRFRRKMEKTRAKYCLGHAVSSSRRRELEISTTKVSQFHSPVGEIVHFERRARAQSDGDIYFETLLSSWNGPAVWNRK